MNRYTTIVLMVAVFAVGLSVIGANGMLPTPSFLVAHDLSKDVSNDMNLGGHITVVVHDPEGGIKAYRQTDNIVLNFGETCAGARLFGGGAASCDSPNLFNFIAIGVGTTAETISSLTTLQDQLGTRVQDTSNILTNSTGTGATSAMSAVFSSFTSSSAIAESALYDASVGGHGFARKTLSPVVNVQSGDSLTVTWTITTGS